MRSDLSAQLAFLEDQPTSLARHETADWLRSSFSDSIWVCVFGSVSVRISFEVRMTDGRLLTHPKHRGLLNAIKMFLCFQTSAHATGSRVPSPVTARSLISRAVAIIDYFLIRGEQFEIPTNGFSSVTSMDVLELLDVLMRHRGIKASLYDASGMLARYFESRALSAHDLRRAIAEAPGIASPPTHLSFFKTADACFRARAFLWLNGYYSAGSWSGRDESAFAPAMSRLLRNVFQGRILGNTKYDDLPVVADLCFGPGAGRREFPAVPTDRGSEDERPLDEYVEEHVRVLRNMALAARAGIHLIPLASLSAIDEVVHVRLADAKAKSRFVTLPHVLVMRALDEGLEFAFDFGPGLISSYLSVVDLALEGNVDLRAAFSSKRLDPTLSRLEIKAWDSGQVAPPGRRRVDGLYDALLVLLGASLVVIGLLSARRSAELASLRVGGSLHVEEEGWLLRFRLGKATVAGLHEEVSRPIPNCVARILGLFQQLHLEMTRRGYEVGTLLSLPRLGSPGLRPASKSLFNEALDRYCDYIGSDLDAEGRRYYIRHHQLRRAFAILFFWHHGYGGIEVIRHYLGHRDPAHTHRYISEAAPGWMLRDVDVNFLSSRINARDPDADAVVRLLQEEYGVARVTVRMESDLRFYLDKLLAKKRVSVEPIFLKLRGGWKDVKVMIKVDRNACTAS